MNKVVKYPLTQLVLKNHKLKKKLKKLKKKNKSLQGEIEKLKEEKQDLYRTYMSDIGEHALGVEKLTQEGNFLKQRLSALQSKLQSSETQSSRLRSIIKKITS